MEGEEDRHGVGKMEVVQQSHASNAMGMCLEGL